MTKRNRHKIAFVIFVISGIGFLIGGIFLTPLLGVGAALLAAAAGFYQGTFVVTTSENEVARQAAPSMDTNTININIDNRQVIFTPMFELQRQASSLEHHRPHILEMHEDVRRAASAPQLTVS